MGSVVFETSDIDQGWNGQHFKTGKTLPNGVYVCPVNFLEPRGLRKQIKKSIVLIR